jgi:hypothetical protein
VGIGIFVSATALTDEQEVEPQALLDAISTLSPTKKVCVNLPYPGEGPEFFLNWARAELDEAATAKDYAIKLRKYYNAAVLARSSVECLLDWYLSNRLLNFTIAPFAGAAQKLEALDSEKLLGISFSLFNEIVFEPRNRGVHKFELVDEKEANHAYDLANLTIGNCVHRVSPENAPLLYGNIISFSGVDEVSKKMPENSFKDVTDAFYFGGIGTVGDHGVLLDRTHKDGKVSVLENLGDQKTASRYCVVRNKLTSSDIRNIFQHLERNSPQTVVYRQDDLRHILEVLIPTSRERRNRGIENTSRRRRAR